VYFCIPASAAASGRHFIDVFWRRTLNRGQHGRTGPDRTKDLDGTKWNQFGSDNGKRAKRRSCPQAAFPARFQNAQTACCVCCQFERWRGKISSSNLFQGNPPQRKLSSLLLPYSLGQKLINLDFLFRKFSSVYPCQQLQFHWFVGQNS